jgi:hypothetical protein
VKGLDSSSNESIAVVAYVRAKDLDWGASAFNMKNKW